MDKKLKILYIIPRFHPWKGGVERNFEALAERMVKEGHDVHVLTTEVRGKDYANWKYKETYKGIKIERMWQINNQLYAGFYPMLLPKLLLRKYDVIHVSGFGFIWTEFCLTIKKIISRKTKFISTPHGPFMSISTTSLIRRFIKTYYTQILKIILPWLYNYVIAVLDVQKEWLTKEYKIKLEKIRVVQNGIDVSYIEKDKRKISKDETVIITFLNRMEKYKGIQDVIKALGVVRSHPEFSSGSNFQFLIMGRKAGYTDELIKMTADLGMQDCVQFIYSPSDEERDKIFHEKSQINILPSEYEATGIALIEAMAKGNAIVTTNQNDAVDLLINSKSGFSYNFGDVDALVEILNTLITDYDLRMKMIKNNLEFAKEFTWEKAFENYKKIFVEIQAPNSKNQIQKNI